MSHMQTVIEIYQAFGRGSLPTVLTKLADSVEWEYGEPTTNVPWLQRRAGKDGAKSALAATFSGVETQSFTPKAFLEGEGVVAALSSPSKRQESVWSKRTGFTFGVSMMKEKSRVFGIVSTRISKSWHVESESSIWRANEAELIK